MNHLPGSDVVQDHGGRIAISDAAGDGKEMFGLTHQKLRKTAMHGERGHALAQFETGNTGAKRIDHAGDLIAGHEGNLGANM